MARTTVKNDTVEDVLKALKRTEELKNEIYIKLGLHKTTEKEAAEDMYEFQYAKPNSEIFSYIILHGKCIENGTNLQKSWGYVFEQRRHFPKKDKSFCRVRCAACKIQLDEKEATKLLEVRNTKLAKQHEEYLEEKAIREEWEAEQILLGRL
jgi:hypothetical protein